MLSSPMVPPACATLQPTQQPALPTSFPLLSSSLSHLPIVSSLWLLYLSHRLLELHRPIRQLRMRIERVQHRRLPDRAKAEVRIPQ